MLQVIGWRWLTWGQGRVGPGGQIYLWTDREEHHVSTSLKLYLFLSSHVWPWWGFFRTDWRKNLAWFTGELSNSWYWPSVDWCRPTQRWPLETQGREILDGQRSEKHTLWSTLHRKKRDSRYGTTWPPGHGWWPGSAFGENQNQTIRLVFFEALIDSYTNLTRWVVLLSPFNR